MNRSDDFELQNGTGVPLTETLTADGRRVVESSDETRRKIELNTQRALDEAGFGKFNYKTILVSGLICINATFSITSLGFFMPSAACDFGMDTVDKGRISTSLISGMLCGIFVWGWIADTQGRKKALQRCLLLHVLSECAAALISNYWGFVFFKFFSGLAESGQITIVYTYLGEFQPTKYREKVLSYMQIAFVVGVILSPVIAWFVIPLDVELKISFLSFKSWNLFVITGAVFPFLIAFSLLPLPETPKYLADSGRHIELCFVLTAMYRENTGNTSEEYLARLNKAGILLSDNRASGSCSDEAVRQMPAGSSFRKFFKALYGQTGGLVKRAYIGRTLNICIGTYLCFASIYSLMFWFPEIFHRFADFEERHPGERSSICTVSRAAALMKENEIDRASTNSSEATPEIRICDGTIETSVYANTLTLGLAGIPTTIVFTLTVARLGFRFYLALNSFVCCAATVGMIFVTSSMQNLIISCIYSSLMTISIAAIHSLAVELFPTNLRVSAAAFSALFGRIGAFAGNATFGYLVDYHCHLLISIVAAELFLSGVLAVVLTTGDQDTSKRRRRTVVDAECIKQ